MKRFILAAAMTLALPALALANTAAMQPVSADEFIRKASGANMLEIETSKYILDQPRQTDEIKEYANKMITDHTAAQQKLAGAANQAGLGKSVPTQLDPQHANLLNGLKTADINIKESEYLRIQRQGHEETIAMFEWYSNNGSNATLRDFASKMLPDLRAHRAKLATLGMHPNEEGR